ADSRWRLSWARGRPRTGGGQLAIARRARADRSDKAHRGSRTTRGRPLYRKGAHPVGRSNRTGRRGDACWPWRLKTPAQASAVGGQSRERKLVVGEKTPWARTRE